MRHLLTTVLRVLAIAHIACHCLVTSANAIELKLDELEQESGEGWHSSSAWSFRPPYDHHEFGLRGLAYAKVGNAENGLVLYGYERVWALKWEGHLEWIRSDIANVTAVKALPDGRLFVKSIEAWDQPGGTVAYVLDSQGEITNSIRIPYFAELVLDNDLVYAHGRQGQLGAYDLEGNAVWQVDTGCTTSEWGDPELGIAADGKLVVVGQKEYVVKAYDFSGQELWQQPTERMPVPRILITSQDILLEHGNYQSYIRRQVSLRHPNTHATPGKYMIGGNQDHAGVVISYDSNGSRNWRVGTDLANYFVAAALPDAHVLLLPYAYADYIGAWLAGDAYRYSEDGLQEWTAQTDDRGFVGAVLGGDGRLYVVSVELQQQVTGPNEYTAQLHRLTREGKWEDLYSFPKGCHPVGITAKGDDGFGYLTVLLQYEGERPHDSYAIFEFSVWDWAYAQEYNLR